VNLYSAYRLRKTSNAHVKIVSNRSPS